MEVKLEAQSGLELGNALYPSFQDIGGQGVLRRGQAWGRSRAVVPLVPLLWAKKHGCF